MGNRVFYACRQVAVAPQASFTTFNSSHFAHGVQNFGIRTDFTIDQYFELGQLALYQQIEGVPNIEATSEKCLDGYPLLWHMATYDSTGRTLVARSNARCILAFSLFNDTSDTASGIANSWCVMSGTYISSLGYNFPINGAGTESVTYVTNNKNWYSSGSAYSGAGSGWLNSVYFTIPDSPKSSAGIHQRRNLLFNYGNLENTDNNSCGVYTSGTTLPRSVAGIDSVGRNTTDASGFFLSKVQSIRVNSNLGREELFEQGHKLPYFRYVRFPVEVTCEVEILSLSGDFVEATEAGTYGNGDNTRNESIRIATEEGTRISLGTKNRLQSVAVNGGGTDGANETITYTYRTFNDFAVMHTGDPNASLRISATGGNMWPIYN